MEEQKRKGERKIRRKRKMLIHVMRLFKTDVEMNVWCRVCCKCCSFNKIAVWFSADLERVCLEEEKRREEELKMLQEMDESERLEYLQRKKQEEEQRRNKEEDDKRAEEEAVLQAAEEARLQAEKLARYKVHHGVLFPWILNLGYCKAQD